MSKIKLTLLRSDISPLSQRLVLTSYYSRGGRMIRSRVDSDPYDFQCRAEAEMFDGQTWNNLATLPPTVVPTGLKIQFDLNHAAATKKIRGVEAELLDLVAAILG